MAPTRRGLPLPAPITRRAGAIRQTIGQDMKKIFVAVVAAGVLALAGGARAQGLSSDIGLFKAPFRFIVAGKLMPAGSYRVTTQGQGGSGVLLIESADKSAAAAFASATATPNPYPGSTTVHVEFKNIDGQYFLTQISMPDQDARRIVISKAAAEQMLVKLNLMPAERGDGGSRQ